MPGFVVGDHIYMRCLVVFDMYVHLLSEKCDGFCGFSSHYLLVHAQVPKPDDVMLAKVVEVLGDNSDERDVMIVYSILCIGCMLLDIEDVFVFAKFRHHSTF